MLGTGTDVTERRRLEADLRRAAIEWRDTFDGLPLGVAGGGRRGPDRAREPHRRRAARAARAGRTSSTRRSRRSGRASRGRRSASSLSALAPGRRAGGARGERPADPPHLGGERAGAGARTASGAERAVLNFQDVTETVRLKEQLRQSETMAEIGSIVAGVAHEVRNPLFSISATLDAFESRFGRTEGYERYLAVLRGEITRLTDAHEGPARLRAARAGPTSPSAAWRRWSRRRCRPARRSRAASRSRSSWPRGAAAAPGAGRPGARLPGPAEPHRERRPLLAPGRPRRAWRSRPDGDGRGAAGSSAR